MWAVAAETVLRLITVRVPPRAHEQIESGRDFALAPAGRVFLAKEFYNKTPSHNTCPPDRPSKILLVQVWTLSSSPVPRFFFLSFFTLGTGLGTG